MGKLEKVIVLSVLFVIAVVLVVSLTTDNPIDKKNVSVLGQPAPKTEVPGTGAAGVPGTAPVLAATPVKAPANGAPLNAGPAGASVAAPATLLSANVNTGAPTVLSAAASAPVAPANGIPEGSLLITLDGLQDSYLPDMKFYTWQPGDTFRGIANTFYGDWTKLALLRRANEGRKNVQAGEKILVPVFDLDAPQGVAAQPVTTPKTGAAPTKSATPAKPAVAAKNAKSTTPAATPAAASTGARVHVVKEGESLWKIAKAELGNGALWEKIFQANKDVMSSPEALKTGMKLKIP